MTTTTTDFRCSAVSRDDAEPMAGTAPTETDYLFVEYPGAWGRKAVAESRLPAAVIAHLEALPGVRVQLIRRHGGTAGGDGVRVFAASLGEHPEIRTALLDDVHQLLDLDLDGLAPYAGPLWMVCTNGRRDLCCAEVGRPIARALSTRWSEATWETTHLGGHRFAGTLLALPSGVTLGRLDADSAVEACRAVEQGRVPLDLTRGRAGQSGAAQVAELHLRRELGLEAVDAVVVEGVDGETVRLRADGDPHDVRVTARPGDPRRQSCADLDAKPGQVYDVAEWVRLP